MCRAGGTPAGGEPKLAHARMWLWETLTGGLPRQAPSQLSEGCPEFLSRHSRCALAWPATTARHLNEHARRLLDTHGRHHEPLTWSPAQRTASRSTTSPAPTPTRSTPTASTPPSRDSTAGNTPPAQLGITVEHLHYIARKHPSEIYDPAARRHPTASDSPPLLGAAQLRELIDKGHSLRQIEACTGIYRRTLRATNS